MATTHGHFNGNLRLVVALGLILLGGSLVPARSQQPPPPLTPAEQLAQCQGALYAKDRAFVAAQSGYEQGSAELAIGQHRLREQLQAVQKSLDEERAKHKTSEVKSE